MMELSRDQIETIGALLASTLRSELKAEIQVVSGKVDGLEKRMVESVASLEKITRHDFSTVHGRVAGVGDQVKELDRRINGRIRRLEDTVDELDKKEAVRHATAGTEAEKAAAKVSITRKEVAVAISTLTFVVTFVYGIVKAITLIGPMVLKVLKP